MQLKYPDKAGELDTLVSELQVTAEATPQRFAWARKQSLPPEDAPIPAAAVDAQVDLLVTGDRTHFGRMYGKSLRGAKVTAPAAALAMIMD